MEKYFVSILPQRLLPCSHTRENHEIFAILSYVCIFSTYFSHLQPAKRVHQYSVLATLKGPV